jgi:alpha-galactosidase
VYRHFVAEIALDDTAGQRGSVIFRVFVAREGQWREALTSGVLRGGDPPQPISVDIAGAQAITLIVDYADQGDELDHANWLDARLVK